MKTAIKFALKLWIAICVAGLVIGFALPWTTPAGQQAAHTLAPFLGFIVCISIAYYVGRASARRSVVWPHFDSAYMAGYLRATRDQGRAERERDRKIIEGSLAR